MDEMKAWKSAIRTKSAHLMMGSFSSRSPMTTRLRGPGDFGEGILVFKIYAHVNWHIACVLEAFQEASFQNQKQHAANRRSPARATRLSGTVSAIDKIFPMISSDEWVDGRTQRGSEQGASRERTPGPCLIWHKFLNSA
jgi:hypothetical protein